MCRAEVHMLTWTDLELRRHGKKNKRSVWWLEEFAPTHIYYKFFFSNKRKLDRLEWPMVII